MLAVIRRIGRTISALRLRKTRPAVISEIIDRKQQDAPGEVDHVGAERRLVQHQLDGGAGVLGRGAGDLDHAVVAPDQHARTRR